MISIMHWFYADGSVQLGPYTDEEFQDLVRVGKIQPSTLVWNEGMSEWQAHGTLRQSPKPSSPAPPSIPVSSQVVVSKPRVTCSECKREFPEDEVIRFRNSYICPSCKPVYFQRLKEGVAVPGTMVFAGFWIRSVALLIDWIVLSIVNWGITLGLGPLVGFNFFSGQFPTDLRPLMILYPLELAVGLFYSVWFVGKYGATPGKMALGLKIVTSTGEPISYLRALARFFAHMVSALTCLIGYIMAAFNEEKKALHDMICDTRVIRK